MQGESAHKQPKGDWARSNKNNFEPQLGNQVTRQEIIDDISRLVEMSPESGKPIVAESDHNQADRQSHFTIGQDQNRPIHLPRWLKVHEADPAFQVSWENYVSSLQSLMYFHIIVPRTFSNYSKITLYTDFIKELPNRSTSACIAHPSGSQRIQFMHT